MSAGTSRFDGIEKMKEFLMTVALHTAADDLALKDIESSKQGGGAVALVNRPGFAGGSNS